MITKLLKSTRGFNQAIEANSKSFSNLRFPGMGSRRGFYVLLLGVFLANSNCFAQWKKVLDGGEFRAFYFLGKQGKSKTGFAASSFSTWGRPILYKTTDGGETWKGLYSGDVGSSTSGYNILDFAFKDSVTGWFAEETFAGSKTTDGGNTWRPIGTGVQPDPYWGWGIAYNPGNGGLFLSNSNNNQFTSWDEGATWTRKTSIYGTGFAFADESLGILSSKYANYPTMNWLRTTNGGYDWSVIPMDSSSWQPLAIKNSKTGFAITDFSAKVYRTDDAWDTWHQVYAFSQNEAPRDVDGYHVMSSGCIRGDMCHLFVQLLTGCYMSTDQGLSWKYLGGPPRSLWYVFERRFWVEGNRIYMGAIDTTNAPYASPAQIWMLDLDSLDFAGTPIQMQTQSKAGLGDTVAVNLVLDPSLTGAAAKDTIAFLFRYSNCDRISFDTADWILADSSSNGEQLRLVFRKKDSVAGPNLLHLKFKTYLGESTQCSFAIDSVRFSNATTSSCAPLFTMARRDSATVLLLPICGDSTLAEFMRSDSLLVYIDRVMPNPAGDYVRVEGRGLTVEEVQVFDVMGRRVSVPVAEDHPPAPSYSLGSQEGEFNLDVRSLADGVYYLRMETASTRFVIQR